jgi:eukaryotic-like serine/threonine-protein kinase
MSLGPGSRLDAYEIVRPLGSGGMGEVWLATEVRLGRKVALKVLLADVTRDPSRVQRFEQEARAASALNHPNVCTILALGETSEGQHYIAMEYVEGETLRQRLSTARLTIRESLEIAIQVAAALSAAHESGIVHRDIKPENVMLRPDGLVKVLDFGLAKLGPTAPELAGEDTTRTALKTDAGIVVGTAAYMSPEQARGQEVDARTDIWSLGVLLYEMVAGRSPFAGPTGTDVLAAILDRDPAPLNRFDPHTPGELQRAVSKALRKDRERRYQLVKELRLDLESLREEAFPRQHASSDDAVPGTGSIPSMPEPNTTIGVVPRRHGRALVGAAIVAGVAILATAGGWFWFTHRAHEPLATTAPTITRLTANPADVSVGSARISPDGKYVAYSDPTGIQVRVIDTGETQRLPETSGMRVYAWNGDGTKIRAARCDQHTCTGWDVSILGGSRQPSGAAWAATEQLRATPDGSRLLTIAASGDVKVNLLDGKGPQKLAHGAWRGGTAPTRPPRAHFWRGAAWSPDGSHVYFTRSPDVIETVSASGGSPRTVFRADRGTEVADIGPVLADGRIFAALVKTPSAGLRSAATALVEIHTTAGDATRTTALTDWGSDEIEHISASSDGSRFTFLRTTNQQDVYVVDVDARHTALTTPKRLTLDQRDDFATAWTPDSTGVIFASDRNGNYDLFKQRLDSDVAEPFVVATGEQFLPRVTSDGQWVLYTDEEPEKPTRIMRIPVIGGRPEPLVTYPPGAFGWCHCAFRGRCVLVESGPAPDSPVVVFALDPTRGKQQELTRLPTSPPGEGLTPDGEHYAYIMPEESGIQNRIRILSFHGEPSHEIAVKNAVRLSSLDSFPTGGFLSQEMASPRRPLLFITIEGNAHTLWSPEQLDVGATMPSPDGKHLAINGWTNQSNVWLIDQR